MNNIARITYTGSALPGNAETVVFLNTTVSFPGASYCPMYKLGRIVLDLVNNQAGTLNLYRYNSDRLAANRTLVYTAAVAAVAGAVLVNQYDLRIGEYSDFSLEWLNGATPQTTFRVDCALYPSGVPTV
jgi:hypothetical protein